MNKIVVSAIFGCLLSLGLHAQTNDIKQVLEEIERNNKELKAYESYIESQQLEYKTGNNLPDPQASLYYLPLGTNTTGDYTEFQISQSFEFPTVYAARGKLIDRQEERLQLEYHELRQNVLLPAKAHCQELIYLNKRRKIEQQRVQQAEQVFNQVQELFEREQVGILEFNKAKIAWMQDQFVLEQIDSERKNALIALEKLNGGEAISFDQAVYVEALEIIDFDSTWQQKLDRDPTIHLLKGSEAVSFQQIKLAKNKVLPNITAGFNHQGVMGQNYSGIYGGISIPLWNNRNKINAAEAQYQYQQLYSNSVTTEIYSNYREQYNQYQLLLRKYREYQNTLEGLNSEALLLQAYELDEISFMEYYLELQFYREAYDQMLQIENTLYQLKTELFKHQL